MVTNFEGYPKSAFIFQDLKNELELGFSSDEDIVERYTQRLMLRGYSEEYARNKIVEKIIRIRERI